MVLIDAEMHQQNQQQQQQQVGRGINKIESENHNLIVPLPPPPTPPWTFTSTEEQPAAYPQTAIDSDVYAILHDKSLSADAMYARLQDAMRRSKMSSYQRQYPQQMYKRAQTIHDSIVMDGEKLLRSVSDHNKKSARNLINFLIALPEFSVNGKHEIQLYGETIEDSNIEELLREFSTNRKIKSTEEAVPSTLQGYHQFMNLLVRSNVPLNAIGSERHRQQIISGGGGSTELPSSSNISIPSPPSSKQTTTSPNKTKKKTKKKRKRADSDSDDNARTVWIRGVPVKERKTWKDYK